MKSYTLAQRLAIRIMIVLAVMTSINTCIIYLSVKDSMDNEAEEHYKGVLMRSREELRRALSEVYVATRNSMSELERDIDNPERTTEHLRHMLTISANRRITSCDVYYAPEYLNRKGQCVVPYAVRDSAKKVSVGDMGADCRTCHKELWYWRAANDSAGTWMEMSYGQDVVTEKETQHGMMVSNVVPLHNKDGRFAALLRTNMSLDFIYEKLQRISADGSGAYGVIIDRQGHFIAHPSQQYIAANGPEHDALAATGQQLAGLMKGEEGIVRTDIDGVPSWMYYHTIRHVNWIIAIVVPQEALIRNGWLLNTLIIVIMVTGLLAILVMSYSVIRRTTRPLHRFASVVDMVAHGELDTPLPIVTTHDEVSRIYQAFANMQQSLIRYMERLRETTAQKAAIDNELEIANKIQMDMLLKDYPPFPERSDIDIYTLLTPAREVGGDFYDYLLQGDKLSFCISDVSGKGVPAALIMAVMRYMFRNAARTATQPADIVNILNESLCVEQSEGLFVSMFVGILDLKTGMLEYCNAGHEVPLLKSLRGPLPVERNLPVGTLEDWKYVAQTTQLMAGDMLFLFTDGLCDARNASGQLYSRKRITDYADQHFEETPRQLVEGFQADVSQFSEGAGQSDDITLMAVYWQPVISVTMPANMDDIAKMTDFVLATCEKAQLADRATKQLRLAVEEAVANIINHGEAKTITLTGSIDVKTGITVTICDDGKTFDATTGQGADLSIPADERPAGGLGLEFIHRMTDEMSYRREENKNILTLIKNIPTT